MSDALIEGYARALFEIARAEGTLDEVEDELFRFARSYESSDALRITLTDENLPAEKRQAIVEDLLDGKATTTTVQLVAMVVGSGRGRDLPAIVDSLVERAASAKQLDVARPPRRSSTMAWRRDAGICSSVSALRSASFDSKLRAKRNSSSSTSSRVPSARAISNSARA